MFAAGYSAKVTEKDQQNMLSVFQDFVQGNLLTFDGGQAEVGGGRVCFKGHVIRCLVSGEGAFGPDEALEDGDKDQGRENTE